MNRGWTGIAAGALLALVGTAQAGIIYDNGNPDGVNGNEATLWLQAEDFVLGGGGQVTGATVYVGDLSPAIDTWDALGNVLQWTIFADVGGTPGNAPLVSGNAQNLVVTDTGTSFAGFGNVFAADFDLGTTFNAAAGTTYWFGIHLDTDYANDEDVYWATTGANGTSFGAESNGGTFDNWFINGQEHAFQLKDGAAAVPLPPAAWMGLGLLGAVGALGRRRRRRS